MDLLCGCALDAAILESGARLPPAPPGPGPSAPLLLPVSRQSSESAGGPNSRRNSNPNRRGSSSSASANGSKAGGAQHPPDLPLPPAPGPGSSSHSRQSSLAPSGDAAPPPAARMRRRSTVEPKHSAPLNKTRCVSWMWHWEQGTAPPSPILTGMTNGNVDNCHATKKSFQVTVFPRCEVVILLGYLDEATKFIEHNKQLTNEDF